jgi:hypothetical protein
MNLKEKRSSCNCKILPPDGTEEENEEGSILEAADI